MMSGSDTALHACFSTANCKHKALSQEDGAFLYGKAEAEASGRIKAALQASTAGRNIAVLGWVPEQTGELVAGFSEFSPEGTRVCDSKEGSQGVVRTGGGEEGRGGERRGYTS